MSYRNRLPARPFTEEEDAAICMYASLGMTRAEIAERLGRDPSTLLRRMRRLLGMGRPVADANPHTSRIKGAAAQRAFGQARDQADDQSGTAGHVGFMPLKRPGCQYRNCLCCQKRFWSKGAHNRLCKYCGGKSLDRFSAPATVAR